MWGAQALATAVQIASASGPSRSDGCRPCSLSQGVGPVGEDGCRIVDGVIAANPGEWAEFVALDPSDKRTKKLTGFFTGAIMKATQGKADGRIVNLILAERRSAAS